MITCRVTHSLTLSGVANNEQMKQLLLSRERQEPRMKFAQIRDLSGEGRELVPIY